MSAHTPGPWHVGGVGGCRPQIIYSPSGLAVLRTWGVATQAEEEANAKLAAAAPDLLAALEELRGWYLEQTGLPAVKANSAIAKARGQG